MATTTFKTNNSNGNHDVLRILLAFAAAIAVIALIIAGLGLLSIPQQRTITTVDLPKPVAPSNGQTIIFWSDEDLLQPPSSGKWEVTFIETTALTFIRDGKLVGWRLSDDLAFYQSMQKAHFTWSARSVGWLEAQGCWQTEEFLTVFQTQEHICYQEVPLPDIGTLSTLPFSLQSQPSSVIYLSSDADRAPGTGKLFTYANQNFYLFWLAGDCTPRIVDGKGGYWQVPVAPAFAQGYMIDLPEGWLTTWRRSPVEAAPWRLCASDSFS
jgi:hypothetical protein